MSGGVVNVEPAQLAAVSSALRTAAIPVETSTSAAPIGVDGGDVVALVDSALGILAGIGGQVHSALLTAAGGLSASSKDFTTTDGADAASMARLRARME